MAKSMTGYGRAQCMIGNDHYMIEIHSVNKKSLDIHINMPKEFLLLDIEIRRWVHEKIERGQITLKITKESSADLHDVLPSIDTVKMLKHRWEEYARSLGFSAQDITLSFLAEQIVNLPKFSCLHVDELKKSIQKGFDEAIQAFNSMREQEGSMLRYELEKRLEILEMSIEIIKKRAPHSSIVMRKKLEDKFKELDLLSSEGEERLQRELIIYAEKVDFTEEVVRLHSHLNQFKKLLKESISNLGKTLEFLILEMNRETHTITSKSQDLDVTKEALSMKIELEKMREQIQNIQ